VLCRDVLARHSCQIIGSRCNKFALPHPHNGVSSEDQLWAA